MCYDDHMYCDVCRRHERSCWCFEGRPPELLAQDLAESREREGLCEGHGYIVVVASVYKRGMTWARSAGLRSHQEFRVAIRADQITGISDPVEVVVLGYPDMNTSAEVRILRAAGVKVWDVP